MSDYPLLPVAEGTGRGPRSGNRVLVSEAGPVVHRALADETRWDPVLVHERITLEQLQELQAHEAENRGTPFDLAYILEGDPDPDSPLTLSCVYADQGMQVVPVAGTYPVLFDVTTYLLQAD